MIDNIKDNDRWGTMTGMTRSLDDVDNIEEIENEESGAKKKAAKSFHEVIAKFNPFHDSRGRFATSGGMKTYSANPKTKAGQMAISRSTQAGYGAVMNVHRESKGENIRQNDNWIKSGQKPSKSQLARAQANAPKTVNQMRQNAHTNRVKGTMGATERSQAKHPSRAGTKQQTTQSQATTQSTQSNTKQTPQANASQTPSKASQSLASDVANVTLYPGQKLAIQPRDYSGSTSPKTTKVADDHYQARVGGKDISKNIDVNKMSGSGNAIDKVAKAQGWNKGSTVTTDLETFQKAAAKSGVVMVRSVNGSGGKSANSICKKTMTDGNAPLNGHGGQVYGGGIYLVGAKVNDPNVTGRALGKRIHNAQSHSFAYADTQMMATVHPDAKIATPKQARALQNQFSGLSRSEQAKFGHDVGAYVASKGYDGAQWHDRSDPYITMYNKSAMIYYAYTAES